MSNNIKPFQIKTGEFRQVRHEARECVAENIYATQYIYYKLQEKYIVLDSAIYPAFVPLQKDHTEITDPNYITHPSLKHFAKLKDEWRDIPEVDAFTLNSP